MRKFIKHLNNLFISLVLIIIYFIGVGVSFGVSKLLRRSNHAASKDSLWENPRQDTKTIVDYESSF